MNTRMRSIAAVLAGVGFLTGATGCEDAQARQRAEVQAQVEDAARRLRSVHLSAVDPEGVAAVEREIQSIVRDLDGATGGSSGQDAARSLLSASALRDLASIKAGLIRADEAERERSRRIVEGRLLAAMRLSGLAGGLAEASSEGEQQRITTALEAARSARGEIETQLVELRSPIDEITEVNDAQLGRVDELEAQATALRREAAALGPRDGFPKFMQAKQIEMDAAVLRYEAAHRRLGLDYELQPASRRRRRGSTARSSRWMRPTMISRSLMR
jgi:hypothetical protein